MRIKVTFVLTVLFASSLMASTGTPDSTNPPTDKTTNSALILNKIFFSDADNAMLFVDFEAIQDQIVNINILHQNNLMMEDDVSDLPSNTIYEINLDVIRAGIYTVELITDDGIKIHKEIWVE